MTKTILLLAIAFAVTFTTYHVYADTAPDWVANLCANKQTIQLQDPVRDNLVITACDYSAYSGAGWWLGYDENYYKYQDGKYTYEKTIQTGDHLERITYEVFLYVPPVATPTPAPSGGGGGSTQYQNPEVKPIVKIPEKPKHKDLCGETKTTIISAIKYRGVVNICEVDEKMNLWIDDDGEQYNRMESGTFTHIYVKSDQDCGSAKPKVMERSDCHFKNKVFDEQIKATDKYNAKDYKKTDKGSKTHEYKERYITCDGKPTSYKTQDCKIMANMKAEAKDASKLFDASTLKSKPAPVKTTDTSHKNPNGKLIKELHLKWIKDLYQ